MLHTRVIQCQALRVMGVQIDTHVYPECVASIVNCICAPSVIARNVFILKAYTIMGGSLTLDLR